MAIDPYSVYINERMAPRQLFDRRFLVGQTVIAEVAIAEGVVPLRALRVPAAIADFDYDKAELGQRDAVVPAGEVLGHALGLRARIDERDDRVAFVRVKIERLVHHPI